MELNVKNFRKKSQTFITFNYSFLYGKNNNFYFSR